MFEFWMRLVQWISIIDLADLDFHIYFRYNATSGCVGNNVVELDGIDIDSGIGILFLAVLCTEQWFFTPLGGVYTRHLGGLPKHNPSRGVLHPYIYDERLVSVAVECRQNPTILILRVAQAAKTFIACNWPADNFSFDCLWLVISMQMNTLTTESTLCNIACCCV